jgi:phage tail-like protein
MAVYYPPVGFHFKVEFLGISSGDFDTRFQEVSGLSAEVTTEELAVGGENRFTYRLPNRARYNNLILKRGMVQDSNLISWFSDAIEDFVFKPVDVNVYLLNENHEISATWVLLQAYPVKWSVSDFKAQESSLVIETIELAYQYFRRR